MTFCKYLNQIEVHCSTCREDGIGACHIKLGRQEYFPEKFNLYDTVQIIRHNGQLSVETDIEVKYNTEYPYGLHAGKGPQFAIEWSQKEKALRDYLSARLPSGVTQLRSHQHYNPDVLDPNIVAMHIHVHKRVEDLDEAKTLVSHLAEVIDPKTIEKVLAEV